MKTRAVIRAAALFFGFVFAGASFVYAEGAALVTTEAKDLEGIPYGKLIPELVAIGYSGDEHLRYDVFWTGGVKIGELTINVTKKPEPVDSYEVETLVNTKGSLMDIIYPIHDRHVTQIQGEEKLPFHAEMWQKEGYDYEAHREYVFDQKGHVVRFYRDGKHKVDYKLSGTTNNEFSAFLNSRLMKFELNQPFIVPTFADKKRIPVKVTPIKKDKITTMFGEVGVFEIVPLMTFKGLYEKQGDTVIWYTDDECRVPVRVNSKIVVGSLTARLVSYENPACTRYAKDNKVKRVNKEAKK